MAQTDIDGFLNSFDDRRYPDGLLQNYHLLECLACNAYGETLLLRCKQTGRNYVVKCYIDASLLSHTTEGELLRKLDHGGLPAFAQEYKNEKMLCVVREYAEGTPLDKLVKSSKLSQQQIVSIGMQLCDILSYLHSQTPPVIHRDIKPQNIIVSDSGAVKLIDFGISRVWDQRASNDTVFFGTQEFAPPEQYGFSQTDNRSDIFSLGVLLCWLITGQADVKKALVDIKNKRLAAIVKKCTSFAPKDRYSNAAQVKDALTGRSLRQKAVAFVILALVVVAVGLGAGLNKKDIVANKQEVATAQSARVTFEEPLIEQAVRLALGKDDNQPISKQELLSIRDLYVFGDKAVANLEGYNDITVHFVANDGTVSRGDIDSIADLEKMKNLQTICLAYQNISDLTPLTECKNLENIELKHNPIEDVSPLAEVSSLMTLVLFDTYVTDLSSLSACLRLEVVDVGYTKVTSMAAFAGLDSLKKIAIRKAPLVSVAGIDAYPQLEEIYLSETSVTDLAPLLVLQRLQLVELSKDMSNAAEAIKNAAQFDIIYQ